MKKNLWISAAVCILCLSGCSKTEPAKNDVLTVCTEADFQDDAKVLLELWGAKNDGAKWELEVIPKDMDSGEIKASAIRTELMSGKGPDVFLMLSRNSTEFEERSSLFPNPEKVMHTDTFLPLDEFLEQAEYMKPENWNRTILEAGRTTDGQMILPLTYRYQRYAFPKADLKEADEIPASWDEFRICKDAVIQGAMYPEVFQFYQIFGKLADYEEGKLLFSEEELKKRAQEACVYLDTCEKTLPQELQSFVYTDNGFQDAAFYDTLAAAGDEMVIGGFPNVDGGITAAVDLYAAVNRNTKMRDEAFSFLDLFFCEEIVRGQQVEVKGKFYGWPLPQLTAYMMSHKDNCEIKYPQLSKSNLMALQDTDARINAVRFCSDLEKELDVFFDAYRESAQRGEDESKREELVSKTYSAMEMKVLE